MCLSHLLSWLSSVVNVSPIPWVCRWCVSYTPDFSQTSRHTTQCSVCRPVSLPLSLSPVRTPQDQALWCQWQTSWALAPVQQPKQVVPQGGRLVSGLWVRRSPLCRWLRVHIAAAESQDVMWQPELMGTGRKNSVDLLVGGRVSTASQLCVISP